MILRAKASADVHVRLLSDGGELLRDVVT